MSRKILTSLVIPGVILFVGACAQQPQQEATPAAEPAPAPAMDETMSAAGMGEMTMEKVTEIATLVVNMAKNPDGAADMLAQAGMTQEQLDEAVAKIEADPTMKAAFDQAKMAAESGADAMQGAADAAQGAADAAGEHAGH